MHLLTATNNNIEEWCRLRQTDSARPRMPLPYALGGAFLVAGHELSALDLSGKATKLTRSPFHHLYDKRDLMEALRNVDAALLWGGYTLSILARQALSLQRQKNILYFSYVISPEKPTIKQRLQDALVSSLSGAAMGMMYMTREQANKARELLGEVTPVIQFRLGIDTAFYRLDPIDEDVPPADRVRVDQLLDEPYIIMPGDELRFNRDALQFVERTGIRLVRVSQYGEKSGTDALKREILARGLADRLMVFEKIEYKFLRFLLRHACAYAGFVDSSWQPAGWTVACEALASGLPLVLYEGLCSRELGAAKVSSSLVQTVAMRDVSSFSEKLGALVNAGGRSQYAEQAMQFAAQHLDFAVTAPNLVNEVAQVVSRA